MELGWDSMAGAPGAVLGWGNEAIGPLCWSGAELQPPPGRKSEGSCGSRPPLDLCSLAT